MAVIAAVLSVLLLSASAYSQLPVMIDGSHRPSRVRVSYRFECDGTKVRLGYRQEERDLESVGGDVAQALSVDLTELKVSGRRIAPDGVATVSDVLHRYGKIESVRAECSAGEVRLSISGLDLELWAARLRAPDDEPRQRAYSYLREVRISRSGDVSVH